MKSISVILLAGGVGSRMESKTPKQYLDFKGIPLILHSFNQLKTLPNLKEIIVVCDPSYKSLFKTCDTPLLFALPGKRRQDSVYEGFKKVSADVDLVCIHDGARPFLKILQIEELILKAAIYGASTLAVPLKFTVKRANLGLVSETIDRSELFEIQTPQVIKYSLLKEGFKNAIDQNLEVTDDVSLVELLDKPVKLVIGSYDNIKITTKEDLTIAEMIWDKLYG